MCEILLFAYCLQFFETNLNIILNIQVFANKTFAFSLIFVVLIVANALSLQCISAHFPKYNKIAGLFEFRNPIFAIFLLLDASLVSQRPRKREKRNEAAKRSDWLENYISILVRISVKLCKRETAFEKKQ